MNGISIVGKKTMAEDETKAQKNYLTTTELARLCGVSRFTIINWLNQGKIGATRTVGGHYRIPVSKAKSFLESFQKAAASGSSVHCWEYVGKTNCDRECKDCLIYGREIDYCFVVVQQFGKGAIRCKGDCLNCGYFDEFFSSYGKRAELEVPRGGKSRGSTAEKRNLLYGFIYGLGRGVHNLKAGVVGLGRGVHNLKAGVVGLRGRLAGRLPRIGRWRRNAPLRKRGPD